MIVRFPEDDAKGPIDKSIWYFPDPISYDFCSLPPGGVNFNSLGSVNSQDLACSRKKRIGYLQIDDMCSMYYISNSIIISYPINC